MSKIMTNLKNKFCEDIEIQAIMKKYYQIKRNLIILSIFSKKIKKNRAEVFNVHQYSNKLSNDISHFDVAQKFTSSICLRYVDKY